MQLFYTDNVSDHILTLPEDEARHCLSVLRKKEGELITVTDGLGHLFQSRISKAGKQVCVCEIESTETQPENAHGGIHIAIAPTKNLDRMEWLVEKLVEVGVGQISFIECEHSERRVLKTERLKKIAVAAMKQSLKWWLPTINELTAFKNFIKQENGSANRFIAYCETETTELLQHKLLPNGLCTVLIGPEGDFSEKEVAAAGAVGFMSISLGNSRLRTETAALVAATLINAKFEL